MSTNVLHRTNLPKVIDKDFVSYPGDYDFPLYLSEKKEWVHLNNIKGTAVVCEPFLIMELNRLVPYLDDNKVKFHPLNMPYVKIGKIEIVGFVLYVSEDEKYYEIRVDDGTGIMSIYYDKKHFTMAVQKRKQIEEKYAKWANTMNMKQLKTQECPQHFPTPRPKFNYPVGTSKRNMAIFEHNWSLETDNGSLGRRIQLKDYVQAIGYCAIDFMFGKKPEEEITFTDLSRAKISFYATKVVNISEHNYNSKLCSWFNTVVRRRYDEQPNKPKLVS